MNPARCVFKAGNQRHQMLHFGDVFGRREQEQDRVEIAFFRYYAVFAQIVGQNGRRNAEVTVVTARRVYARRGEQQLARGRQNTAIPHSLQRHATSRLAQS
jgi:hypothetical protein